MTNGIPGILKNEQESFLAFVGVPVTNLINIQAYNAAAWSDGFINPPFVFGEMHQHIKATASVAIKPFRKQKRKRYNGWLLVRDQRLARVVDVGLRKEGKSRGLK